MDHRDHVTLLKKAITRPGGVWADFGSGRGAFTLALAELIGPGGTIYSIDKDGGALRKQERELKKYFPEVEGVFLKADFSRAIELPPLDGLVMANALHFLKKKDETVRLLRDYLKPGGPFILVEYNTDKGNHWVPHPLSFETWSALARRNGFSRTTLLATLPSRFLGQIFSAASWFG